MNFTIPLLLAGLLMFVATGQAQQTEPDKVIDAFAMDPAMSDAQVSPDGSHIATLQRFTKDGKQFVLIYDASDMTRKPVTLGSAKMNIVAFDWINNERLVIRFRQDVDTLEKLGAFTRQAFKLAIVDRQGKQWLEIPRKRADRRSDISQFLENFGNAAIMDSLPKDDTHILIEYDDDRNGISDIFKVNVETGSARRVARNTSKINITYVDADTSEPRLAQRFDESESAIVYLARLQGEQEWIEMGRTVAEAGNNSKIFNALLQVKDDRNKFYVLSNHETDTAGIYIYDLEQGAFGELQFRHPKYDASGVRTRLDDDKNEVVIGFTYTGKAGDIYLTDPEEAALYLAIDKILPDTRNRIVSRSDDQNTLIIRAAGPKSPPTWYLLQDNTFNLLGQALPFLTEDMLAEVEWVTYAARDGLQIPALVTIPNGEGPFPVIVHPHGGPVARDYWGFDLWAQMLAYHGYLVIQPQFRISEGFGRRHLEAGYARWGYEMQDDLDDAITYLAERKLADPERAGIFGWSYGGYAAFVGSFRDPNPYRCAISGAGVADVPFFRARLNDFGDFTEKTYRLTVDGINPIDHVDSVDIPILVIHGDIDERVPVAESHKFVKLLKKFNKQHKYLELEGANHFFTTIYYRHFVAMYTTMLDWLDNTCEMKTG